MLDVLEAEIKDILISIQAIDKKGNMITFHQKKLNFEYRDNNLSDRSNFFKCFV